jgi:hypothetical protein
LRIDLEKQPEAATDADQDVAWLEMLSGAVQFVLDHCRFKRIIAIRTAPSEFHLRNTHSTFISVPHVSSIPPGNRLGVDASQVAKLSSRRREQSLHKAVQPEMRAAFAGSL